MHYKYYGSHAEPTANFNKKSMTYEQLRDYAQRVKIANDMIIADIRSRNSR